MNEILIDWGIDPKLANMFDETIIAVLMIGVSIGLDYLCQAIFVGGMRRYTKRAPHQWNTLLMKRKVVHHLIHVLPGILVYFLLPLAFVRGKEILDFSQKICAVYIIAAILFTINGLLLVMLDVYNAKDKQKSRPMKGFVQVLQVLLFFIGGIIIIAVLLDKSPMTLFAGLGASAAVLMLVFKDSILGFVAGVQLSANDMLRIGDWISLPNDTANGTVEEITLNTVKIRNWDNTISTVPPYTLVNNSFQNWRGMQESGGRGLDPMQAAEGSFNTRYPHEPNGIQDPEYSIQCGVQELKAALISAEVENPIDMERIKLALQGYNFGNGISHGQKPTTAVIPMPMR